MFKRNRKTQKSPQHYQVRYNERGEIQVYEIDAASGLALILVGLFANVGQYNRWRNTNQIAESQITWGSPNENATVEFSRKWAM
jgi:hypothetical protein